MIYPISNIDIFIQQDWSKVTRAFQDISDKIDRRELDEKAYMEPAYGSMLYPLGRYGAVLENFNLTDGSPWRTWTGEFLESFLPWSKNLRQVFESSSLDFVGFSFSRNTDNVKSHIDGKKPNEGLRGHCNLNYLVFCENPSSYTFAIGSNNKESRYLSQSGTAWLLATDVLHGVKNQGVRDVFQLKFYSPFVEVKEWLENHHDVFSMNLVS